VIALCIASLSPTSSPGFKDQARLSRREEVRGTHTPPAIASHPAPIGCRRHSPPPHPFYTYNFTSRHITLTSQTFTRALSESLIVSDALSFRRDKRAQVQLADTQVAPAVLDAHSR